MIGNHPVYRVVPSTLYPGLFYCERCQGHYTPNLEWGYSVKDRNDTSSADPLIGIHRKGTECPFCGTKPEVQ